MWKAPPPTKKRLIHSSKQYENKRKKRSSLFHVRATNSKSNPHLAIIWSGLGYERVRRWLLKMFCWYEIVQRYVHFCWHSGTKTVDDTKSSLSSSTAYWIKVSYEETFQPYSVDLFNSLYTSKAMMYRSEQP